MQLLLQAGTDVQAKTDAGLTALILAARGGHPDIALALVGAGATLNAKTDIGLTALMWAAWAGDCATVQTLIEAGAAVNAKTDTGLTALRFAVGEGHGEVVRILLDRGADVHARDAEGWTALTDARKRNQTDIVNLLKNAVIMLPEPRLLEPSVTVKDSDWKKGADRVVVRAVGFDFAELRVDYTISEREADYYKENKWTEQQIRQLQEYEAYQETLWYSFANKPPESQFDPITTENWYEKWCHYQAKLVEKATDSGFDGELLKRCFEKIEPNPDDKIALLPIGAYLARKGNENVWIIICKWEYASAHESKDGKKEFPSLGHVRGWALMEKDQTEITFFTCGRFPFFCQSPEGDLD